MAKSSRSKWKKLHRQQRARDVAAVVAGRIGRLNEKLSLAAGGGLSAVPMEDAETRFHFVNPEVDVNVPRTFRGPNNNYSDIARESLDFTKPLQLRPARTNFHGKSDPTAPHPTTWQRDVVSAAAPVAGHAISVGDVERMAAAQQQRDADRHANEEEEAARGASSGDNEMEEFVLGCNDAEEETTANVKALLAGGVVSEKKGKKTGAAPRRIESMKESGAKKSRVVQVAGDKKAKRLSNAPPTRLVKSSNNATRRRLTAG